MDEVLSAIQRWRSEGQAVALATVVQTWGSAPRQAGAKLAVSASGQLAGSVSGGCVEGAVAEAALAVLDAGQPQLLEYGVADETSWAVGLACGGTIRIFVEPLHEVWLAAGAQLLAAGRSGAVVSVIGGPAALLGRKLMVEQGQAHWQGGIDAAVDGAVAARARSLLAQGSAAPLTCREQGLELFIELLRPPPRLVMVGGVHIARVLAGFAKTLGYHTVVVDPRQAFGSRERFAHVDQLLCVWPDEAFAQLALDEHTALALLTHDPKLDDPALELGLRSRAFYLGALGSRQTHAQRLVRLRAAGFGEAELVRIHAPIGLPIEAQTPEEIALAVMAEIVQARHGARWPSPT